MTVKLNVKQKLFCQYFASGVDTCGNGVQSYAKAYGYDLNDPSKYQSAKVNAHRLLNSVEIDEYISELLEELQITPEFIQSQLRFLILQNTNFAAKLGAIGMYLKYDHKFKKPIDERGSELGRRGAELARRYMRPEEWETEYSHYFTEPEITAMKAGQSVTY